MVTCYRNARIFSGSSEQGDCFAVQDGRFVFAGSEEEARERYPMAEYVDLNGQFVCPGFNDSHMHLLELGCVLTQAQLNYCTDSLSHVLDGIRSHVTAHPQETWILGRGWNQDYFSDERRYPDRKDLDNVCPDKPCLITRACGHVAIANSAALRLAGIDQSAPEVEGGCVVCDDDGRPSGILEENAIALVSSHIPAPDRAGIKQRILLAMETVSRFGVTSVQSDDFGALEVPFEEVIAAYLELKAEERMTVRVTEQCLLPTEALLDRFLSMGYRTGWGDEWFRIGPLKLLTDGSLGARTAYLRAPYTDEPITSGIATYSRDALNALILKAHRSGMQIAAHAIGDAAADLVMDAIEHAQRVLCRENARHGIVHAQILNHDQTLRMQKLNLHAYIQPIFLDYDTQIVFQRIGSRADEAYPAKSFSIIGVTFSSGSDCPVEPSDVLKGIQCAVTRKSVSRPDMEPYLPHEALTLTEALLSFTAYGAYSSFEEDTKGCIAAGYLADFTVLGIDPYETDPRWISKIPVKQVFVSGKRIL